MPVLCVQKKEFSEKLYILYGRAQKQSFMKHTMSSANVPSTIQLNITIGAGGSTLKPMT